MCVHERVLFQPWGLRKTRMPWLLYYGCGFERTLLMRCHGINRLHDGFLGVYGKSETLGPCSALAALGTLTCGPRVSDFPYTPRTHRLTYIYSLNVNCISHSNSCKKLTQVHPLAYMNMLIVCVWRNSSESSLRRWSVETPSNRHTYT